jgi:ATP-dependent DNA helicase RecQ
MLKQNLQKYFNFSEFRPGQEEIVRKILDGKDVVALMPTGGGKSLCYQLPAVMNEGISIIISPLIALMKDQVDSLNARGIPATFINSSLDGNEIERRMRDILEKKAKILYIAPERFGSSKFSDFFKNMEVDFLAVDEAHCVSQWGHDFRPDYLHLREYIKMLKKRPTVAAFTATATPEVKEDIIKRLELKDPEVFIRGFDRPNLRFFVQSNLKPKEKYVEILRIIKNLSGSGIIYSLTRKESEFIAKLLNQNKVKAAAYHAGMEASKRERIQNEFMDDKFKVIVATIAFGMGVDKADVRFVIHCGMPGSLEGYYQEAGRAGRDGEMAYCMLLHGKKDVNTHKFFIRQSQTEMFSQGKRWEDIKKVIDIKYNRLEKMIEYATKPICRREIILKYFDDPDYGKHGKNCQGCDVCLNWKKSEKDIRKINSAIRENKSFITATVQNSVDFYEKGFSAEKIAKIRSLGMRTILDHLIDWYATGGKFKMEEYLNPEEEAVIRSAINKVGSGQKLKPIKNLLPEEISYEKIKMTVAKIQREAKGD